MDYDTRSVFSVKCFRKQVKFLMSEYFVICSVVTNFQLAIKVSLIEYVIYQLYVSPYSLLKISCKRNF